MEFHNMLRLLFLVYSLLIPLHLARPEIFSSLHLESSPPVLSPSSGPAYASSPSPGASIASPSPGPAFVPSPSSGPASVPTPSSGPASGPSPSSEPALGPGPGPSPSSGPVPGPTPSSGPELGPSPSSGSAPGLAPGSSPSSGPVQGPWPSIGLTPGSSPSLGQASGPSPSMSEGPTPYDGSFRFDFSPTPAPSADVDPKVKEICYSTDHPSLCLATVVPLLNGETDVPSVLNAAIKAGAEFSKYGQALAQELVEEPENPPELASVLDDCKRSYTTAVDDYENTVDAFPEHDVGTMNSMLSSVITNVGDCEDAFLNLGQDSPFASIAARLKNMTSNCLAIVSLLD